MAFIRELKNKSGKYYYLVELIEGKKVFTYLGTKDRLPKGYPRKNLSAKQKEEVKAIYKRGNAQNKRMKPKFGRLKELEGQGIYIGTIWDFGKRADYAGRADFHGNSIPQIVENSLLLYSKKRDLVLDPMAGSGTTLDVCRTFKRRCKAYDIYPTRRGIEYCDARYLEPVTDKTVDYIFLHPPYWELVEYSKNGESQNDLSTMSYEEYLQNMKRVFGECRRVLKRGKVLTLLIGDLVTKGKYVPIAIPLYNQLVSMKMQPIGIAIKTTNNSRSQVIKGKTIWAELAVTNNLKIEHDFVMHFRKL